MEKTEIKIGDFKIIAEDYRKIELDYFDYFYNEDFDIFEIIPSIDDDFFISQGHNIPAVKIGKNSYLFPKNAIKTNKRSSIEDYHDFCIVNLDILVLTQNFHYDKAKFEYEDDPEYVEYFDFKNHEYSFRKRSFKKRSINIMSFVQLNLAIAVHGSKEKAWVKHYDTQEEIKFKHNDLRFHHKDYQGSFEKGDITSYGIERASNKLRSKYGVYVKLQNGSVISNRQIDQIKFALRDFSKHVINLKQQFFEFNLLISHSQEKLMHGRNYSGIFFPRFNAIGVSNHQGHFSQILAHEIGHFIDYFLEKDNPYKYSTDVEGSNANTIAKTFRKNLSKKQISNYQNRTTECFARAIEQFYCKNAKMELNNSKGNFCDPQVFEKEVEGMIVCLIDELRDF